MELQTLFLLTNFIVAAVSAFAFAGAMFLGESWAFLASFVLSGVTTGLTSIFAARWLKQGLRSVEAVLTDDRPMDKDGIGIKELDQFASRLAKCAQHWEAIAAVTRNQSSEFQAVMTMLDRRQQDGTTSRQVRSALIRLGRIIESHLAELKQSSAEIEQHAKGIAEGADAQGNAVIKTTAYVEQLSTTIDTVSSSAASAQAALLHAAKSAEVALKLVTDLSQGMRRVQTETESCEKKLKGLCDPARQISAIVETVGNIAARTNLLALNASIESIRAGEHGRGFALVAEEVRSLAEQATGATREISSLLDSMQLATQESIRGIVREREQVEAEVQRAQDAELALRQVAELDNNTRSLEQISESSKQQLQLAQDVVSAVEQISKLAKANRGNAESVGWNAKSLAEVNPQLSEVIERLCACDVEEPHRPEVSSHNPIALTTSVAASGLAPIG